MCWRAVLRDCSAARLESYSTVPLCSCGELYLCVPPRFILRLQGPLLFVEDLRGRAVVRV